MEQLQVAWEARCHHCWCFKCCEGIIFGAAAFRGEQYAARGALCLFCANDLQKGCLAAFSNWQSPLGNCASVFHMSLLAPSITF